MKRFTPSHTLILLGSLLLLLALSSCATQNLFESKQREAFGFDSTLLEPTDGHRLRADDKISVSVWDHNDLSVGSIFGIYNSNEVYGKWVLVNSNGEVLLPKLGTINLGGLTTDEAGQKLSKLYSKYILDPIIVVKVLNREVSVMGEITNPGIFLLEKERNTLFEILSRAGGPGFYAQKSEVIFIRNERKSTLDLTRMDQFTLNNIVMQSGDIIYIPAKNGKTLDKKAPTLIPFASVLTTVAILFSLFSNSN